MAIVETGFHKLAIILYILFPINIAFSAYFK